MVIEKANRSEADLLAEIDDLRERLAAAESRCEEVVQRSMAHAANERKQRERYRAIIEAFDGIIYICSPDYLIEYINPLGIQRAGRDITGEPCYQALHDRDSLCPWCVNKEVHQGKSIRWEVKSPKDGRWYYSSNTPIKNPDGSISKLAMIQDITERRRAEQNEEMFATLLDHNPSLLFLKDEDGTYVYLNQAYEKQYALTPDWRGKTDYDFWPKESADLFRENDAKTLESGKTCQFLEDSFDLQGARHCWLCYKFPFTDSQGRRYIGGIGFDAIQQVEAEEALKRLNEELELRVLERTAELREKDHLLIQQSRMASMGEMTSYIAHQWRQPLNNLGLLVQHAKIVSDLGELSREHVDHTVRQSMAIIHHMSRTIDDFINFCRPDKTRTSFDVAEVIRKTVNLLDAGLASRNIRVEIEVKGPQRLSLGNENEYAQTMLVLLQNARDAFLERKTCHPCISISTWYENGYAIVTVADNAGGIPKAILKKIFDPYFSTKKPAHGSGLGLFMSKTIIEKNMGGRITVRNTSDGAEFRLEIPADSPVPGA